MLRKFTRNSRETPQYQTFLSYFSNYTGGFILNLPRIERSLEAEKKTYVHNERKLTKFISRSRDTKYVLSFADFNTFQDIQTRKFI